jgi:tight adherence protein C
MSLVSLLAALAALLAAVGWRDLAGARALATRRWAPRLDGRAARAALRLGLPERIARAGLKERSSLSMVLAAKAACALAGGLVGLMAAPAAPGRISLLVWVGMPVAGFLLPDALIERRARQRHRRLLAALPDACDLLAVGAAAGRGTAAGFAEVARAGDGPLASELRVAAAELDCGRPLSVALRALRDRVPGAEVAALAATIERSRRYGSPLAEQLQRHSVALRRAQRRAVEESAARAAPKIQLVIALVLVPSVLLMIAAALIANADVLLSGFA